MLAIEIHDIEYHSGVSVRRTAISLDMPYGSELFNRTYNGPAVAIVGAISTVSVGASIGGLLGGIMIAGGVASGLGALTGNKTLSTIGMGLGLASGIGAGFTNATTGEFMNPFAEGFNFSDTALGSGFSKIKSFFSDVGGQQSAPGLADKLMTNGNDIVNSATSGLPTSASNDMGLSLAADTAGDTVVGTQNIRNLASSAAPVASSGGGLLSSLGGTRDIMALAGGLADGYQQGQYIEQAQPLTDARVDQLNAETDLMNNRYKNMQAQPGVNIGVNSDAQIFNKGTSQGKVAVVVDGKVQYMTAEQYAQLKQAQQAQQQGQATGLLASQGTTNGGTT